MTHSPLRRLTATPERRRGRGRRAVCLILLLSIGMIAVGCGRGGEETVRIAFEPPATGEGLPAGTMPLGLGERLFINRGFFWRDGLVHVPPQVSGGKPAPLLIWLHGGGGKAGNAKKLFPIASEFGVVVLALDSRHNTWDGIDSPFGPDVRYIERALAYVAGKTAIDPQRIALGGVSDGGSYALALGRSNGTLFSHIIAVSPGRLKPPAPAEGEPRVFIAHGREDAVYPEWHSRRVLVPSLRDDGYDVTYFSYDGPHWVTDVSARELMRWFAEDAADDAPVDREPPVAEGDTAAQAAGR